MLHEKIILWDEHPEATLTTYVYDTIGDLKAEPRPAIILCPGGGYSSLSTRESEPVASEFLAEGMNVYILRYSTKEKASGYAPLIEAALAIKYVRENAELHNTDPNKVFIGGGSAGGHLAAAAGILWNIKEVRDAIGVTDGSSPEGINKPTGLVLSYPFITTKDYENHREITAAIYRLCGTQEPTEEEVKRYSMELYVDETTSPVFLWHTIEDEIVPIENSLLLLNALIEHNVPCEAHIYPKGAHGLSLCNKKTWSQRPKMYEPHAETWIDLAIKWINDMF